MNDPGVEAEPFLYQAAYAHLERGGEVVYALLNKPPQSAERAMREFGFDISAHREKVHWIDSYSALMGVASEARYLASNPVSIDEFVRILERASREHPDALLVIDPLSQLIDHAGFDAFMRALPRLQAAARQFALSASVFTRWPYQGEVDALLATFDAVVSLRGHEERVTMSQYFRLERRQWGAEPDVKPRLYKSLKPGGVHVYVPKVVVTGPYNAGKSSFVQALSDAAVSVDRLGTTVALDHGRVTMDGLTADVFGTPGQSRFDPILGIVAGQALGVIVVVDSTKPESFARAREMLDLTRKKAIPAIIAANKQDLPDALPPEEIERMMSPPAGVHVIGCSGNDRQSSRAVLKQLIEQILTGEVEA